MGRGTQAHGGAGLKQPDEGGLDAAIAACRLRGAQITPLREKVLSALWHADRPLTAYELLEKLNETAERKLAAPSVYRTLDFLCTQNVVARIESLNAYVVCNHPHQQHACVFLLCDECGTSIEIEDTKLEKLIAADAEREGFVMTRRVVELSGVCAPCQAATR